MVSRVKIGQCALCGKEANIGSMNFSSTELDQAVKIYNMWLMNICLECKKSILYDFYMALAKMNPKYEGAAMFFKYWDGNYHTIIDLENERKLFS